MVRPKHGQFWGVDFGGCLVHSLTRRRCCRGVCVGLHNLAKYIGHHSTRIQLHEVQESAGSAIGNLRVQQFVVKGLSRGTNIHHHAVSLLWE